MPASRNPYNDYYVVVENTTFQTEDIVARLTMTSESGNYVGQGRTYSFSQNTGDFVAYRTYPSNPSSDNAITVTYKEPRIGGKYWSLSFAAPSNAPLTGETNYTNVAGFPFQPFNQPGLDVGGEGRGSGSLTGQFAVNQIDYGSLDSYGNFENNLVYKVDISFEQKGSSDTGWLRGRIQYGTPNGYAPGVLVNDRIPDIVTGRITASLATGTSYGSMNFRSDGAFTYTPNAGFRGIDTFTYQITDDQGISNPATVTLRVGANQSPTVVTNIEDNDADNILTIGTTQTYTVTFNNPVIANTVNANDLVNVGTAAVQIGTITQTAPNVFQVPVTVTSAGTLQLQISSNATITDTFGVVVTPPFIDNDIITVQFNNSSRQNNIEQVSINVLDWQGFGTRNLFNSYYQSDLSADGRYVVFSTDAEGLGPDLNGKLDVFLHDRQTKTTTLISRGGFDPFSADGDSYSPVISADGRYIVFYSNAPDVAAQGLAYSGQPAVYVHDRQRGITTRIANNTIEAPGNQINSRRPSISSDGRYIAYETGKLSLEGFQLGKVFVYDQQAQVSAEIDSGIAPLVSDDGRYVTYQSELINGTRIFLLDRQTGNTITLGEPGHLFAIRDVTPDGRYLVFSSSSPNLVPEDTNGTLDV